MAFGKQNGLHLYLASNSPRRRELLALFDWEFDTLTPQVDETPLPGEDGIGYVRRLAKSKVYSSANQASVDGVVIAADTTVVDSTLDGEAKIIGKPRDHQEAAEILTSFRGHSHRVHTAISILDKQASNYLSDCCTTLVPMRNYAEAEIEAYVASGDPMDKAGAYGIQNAGFHPVEELEGCYANVMGLPLCHLTRTLAAFGIRPLADVPQACQAALGYNCPVYGEILQGKNQDYTCG